MIGVQRVATRGHAALGPGVVERELEELAKRQRKRVRRHGDTRRHVALADLRVGFQKESARNKRMHTGVVTSRSHAPPTMQKPR